MSGKRKRPVQALAAVQSGRTKRPIDSPHDSDNNKIRFSFHEMDDSGSWCLHSLARSHTERLIKRLKALEDMTPQQLFDNHTMSKLDMTDCPNKPARDRLAGHYDSLDVLHEIRIERSGALRLHGRLDGRFFNIIWWDPNHEVWPEGKRRK